MAYSDILIPVETASRELDAKLLLALFAADAGFRCHIAPMDKIRTPGFPPSIYLSKSVRFTKPVQLMAGFGHIVVAWDEEGLVRSNDQVHSQRIEAGALQIPTLLLSWGSSNSRLWRVHPFYDGRSILDVGNPRIDLLRPEFRPLYHQKSEEIRSRFGDFVLLNTNFSIVNHFKPRGRRLKVSAGSLDSKSFVQYRDGLAKHKQKLFLTFLEAVPSISQGIYPHVLVVRPHPSEDPRPWVQAGKGISNFAVVQEGSVVPWLLAAKCLIHNGCTSGVEATIVRTPALAFCPISDPRYDLALPNDLSEKFQNCELLAERARDHLQTENKGNDDYAPLLRDHIAALDGRFSSERIVEALLALRTGRPRQVSLRERVQSYKTYLSKATIRTISSARRSYQDHKSRPEQFSVTEFNTHIARIRKVLGRFGDVQPNATKSGVITLERSP